jgi:hypothetical protein
MMLVAGVDLGLSGGITMLEGNDIKYLGMMPVIQSSKTRVYDVYKLIYIFKQYNPAFIMVEKPLLHPKSGKISYQQSGYGLGLFTGIATSLGIKFDMVLPNQWQKAILGNFGKGDSKTASIQYATFNYPHHEWKIGKNYHDGLTDSLGIALYCQLKNLGGLIKGDSKHKEVKAGCNADSHEDGIPPNNKLLGILPNEL